MKVHVKRITNNRLIKPTVCDKCDTVVEYDSEVEFFDEWGYPGMERHYYCIEHLLEIAKTVNKELVEL